MTHWQSGGTEPGPGREAPSRPAAERVAPLRLSAGESRSDAGSACQCGDRHGAIALANLNKFKCSKLKPELSVTQLGIIQVESKHVPVPPLPGRAH